MSITLASVISNTDTYFGDSSTDRISQAERFQALTEGTAWLLEELGNEHMMDTYDLEYLDTITKYRVTTPLVDLLTGADLRREGALQTMSFTRKSPREMAEEIGQNDQTSSWAIERTGADAYLIVHFPTPNKATQVSGFDSLTDGGGTWVADTTTSDALNVTVDVNEYKQGGASLNFDVDVSQSGNNRSTVYMPDASEHNLAKFEDLGSFMFWVYIPSVTFFSSITMSWGSNEAKTPASKNAYWSATIPTDINGTAFTDGWNECRVDWSAATMTGTPDSSALVYFEFALNYTASQVDDTDFRLDYLRIAKPEKLTFHYISWYVGTSSGGTPITSFTATTDIPFFSGKYDQYRYPLAHKAASIMFTAVRLRDEAMSEDNQAMKSLDRYRKNFESSKVREQKTFMVAGNNLRRGSRTSRLTRIR